MPPLRTTTQNNPTRARPPASRAPSSGHLWLHPSARATNRKKSLTPKRSVPRPPTTKCPLKTRSQLNQFANSSPINSTCRSTSKVPAAGNTCPPETIRNHAKLNEPLRRTERPPDGVTVKQLGHHPAGKPKKFPIDPGKQKHVCKILNFGHSEIVEIKKTPKIILITHQPTKLHSKLSSRNRFFVFSAIFPSTQRISKFEIESLISTFRWRCPYQR